MFEAEKETAKEAVEIVLAAAKKAEEVEREARAAILHELTRLVSIATGEVGRDTVQEDTT